MPGRSSTGVLQLNKNLVVSAQGLLSGKADPETVSVKRRKMVVRQTAGLLLLALQLLNEHASVKWESTNPKKERKEWGCIVVETRKRINWVRVPINYLSEGC